MSDRLETRVAEVRRAAKQDRVSDWQDWAVAGLLFAAYLTWLLSTTRDLGYSRDEGFYFQAAERYRQWFSMLVSEPSRALTRAMIDRHWGVNHEHPALIKSLFAGSKAWLSGSGLIDQGTVMRLPAMILSSMAVSVTYGWGRVVMGRAGALVAALSFAWMPRVFYHSHLACFDMPMVSIWLITSYAYFRSLHASGWRWILATALLYGLALNTKLNAWFLPVPFVVHWLVRGWLRWGEAGRFRFPLALPAMLCIGPVIWYLGWPWIWHHTSERLAQYVAFHTNHDYYNMEFLGKTYFEPPMPLGYAWVMTLATVPGVTILLAGTGVATMLASALRRLRAIVAERGESIHPLPTVLDAGLLWLLCIGVAYGPWVFPSTPIFGGTKHWMVAYPFAALFAGGGFVWLVEGLFSQWKTAGQRAKVGVPWALGACVLVGSLAMTWQSHPWGLTAYTPLVGGAPGAASLGLNRSFWGYTTGAVQEELNTRPGRKKVFIHDTALQSYRQMQLDGRLSRRQRPWRTVSGSDLALYHHEQHMSRVEHMIWVDYGTTSPVHVGMHDGVPVVWIYER